MCINEIHRTMNNSKYRVVFMGTPEIGIPSLQALIDDDRFDVVGIFTQPDRPVGRNQEIMMSPVKEFGKENYIPVLQPERFDEDANRRLSSLEPDIVVVIAYGQILKKDTLEIPRKGFVNVHFSLLPKYRGAVPVQMAIINGEKVTGNTVQVMGVGLDEGPIIAQEEIEIGENETSGELLTRLAKSSPKLLLNALDNYLNDRVGPVEQDHSLATYCYQKDIAKEKARINWDNSAHEIHNFVRGLNPWPVAWTLLDDKRVRIFRTKLSERCKIVSEKPGRVIIEEGKMQVICGHGILEILEIQVEGKNEVSGSDFVKGYGDVLFE